MVQERGRLRREQCVSNKVMALRMWRGLAHEAIANAFADLRAHNPLWAPVSERDIRASFVPWLLDTAATRFTQHQHATRALDGETTRRGRTTDSGAECLVCVPLWVCV